MFQQPEQLESNVLKFVFIFIRGIRRLLDTTLLLNIYFSYQMDTRLCLVKIFKLMFGKKTAYMYMLLNTCRC